MSNIVLARLGENIKASTAGQVASSTGSTTAPSFIENPIPAGAVVAFARSINPTGRWLYCDGASLNTGLYNPLFLAIGYSFGGSGSSFNLPDLRGIFIRGTDSQTIGGIVYSGTFAQKNTDALQGHIHISNALGFIPGGVGSFGGSNMNITNTQGPINDGVNGVPRVSTQTHPANIALRYWISF